MSLYARAAQGLGYLAEATGAIDLAEEGLEKIDGLTGKRASKFLKKEAAKVMGLRKGDAFKTLPRTVLPIIRNEQLSPAIRIALKAINHETEGLDAVNTSIEILGDQVAGLETAATYFTHDAYQQGYGGTLTGLADQSSIIAGVKNNTANVGVLEMAAAYSIDDVYQQGYGGTLMGVVDQGEVVAGIKTLVAEVERLKLLTSHVASLRIQGDETWDYSSQSSGVFMDSTDARGVSEYDASGIMSVNSSTGVISLAGTGTGLNDIYRFTFEDQIKIVATAAGTAIFRLYNGSTTSPTAIVDEVQIPYANGDTICLPVILRRSASVSYLHWKVGWSLSAAAVLTVGSTNSSGNIFIQELSRNSI